ncbi:M23 family metallopeptidase [Kocuria flava]|uniref:M23 family metallopeptidase n=1 Tax=Kocuria flava TaxID=446860 RepID=UPI002F9301AA
MALTALLVLASCATARIAPSDPADDGRRGEGRRLGWSLFHAAAHQWQLSFALMQVGPPWAHPVSMVEQMRPGARAPRYQRVLPVNTLIAPALPTVVGVGGEYGWRIAPDLGTEELHNGADIGAAEHSTVMAAMDGVVRAVFWDVWGGNRVEVSHPGNLVTTYNHLDKVMVEQGDRLDAAQQLGTVGRTGARVTGPHLHFETWVGGEAVDPQSFDWIVGDRVIPAPRDHAQGPPEVPSGGIGSNSVADASQACPYAVTDPKRCLPPDVTRPQGTPSEEEDPTRTSPVWPDLSSAQCLSTAPGFFDCDPVPDTAPGAEDCPAAPVPDARTDCPDTPPDRFDPTQCRPTDQGTLDCVPFDPAAGAVPRAEDCPAAPVPGARTDCPPVWPDLSSAQCLSTAPGFFDCDPVPDTAPGAEDCPAAPVEGARTDCPDTPPDRFDPTQCRPTDQGALDCVPFDPAAGVVPRAEDCPAAPVPGARTDCPPAAEASGPTTGTAEPPVGGTLAPPPGADAALSGRRRRGPAEDRGERHAGPRRAPR